MPGGDRRISEPAAVCFNSWNDLYTLSFERQAVSFIQNTVDLAFGV